MIFKEIEQHYNSEKPFVAYRKPNSLQINVLLQHNDGVFTTKDFKESGFVLAPFSSLDDTIVIPFNQSEYISESIDFGSSIPKKFVNTSNKSSKTYCDLVSKTIKEIHRNGLKKIVLSRKEIVELSEVDVVLIFEKLLRRYTAAFVYVWYHPRVGLWFGATPETLVEVDVTNFQTMSLAGTQVYEKSLDVEWGQKEIEEQQYVTDYIVANVNTLCNDLYQTPVRTIKAGNLLHLQTIIKGKFNSDLATLLNSLHPTPAVCGLPSKQAKNFILTNEGYNREFYTGFLGEINSSNGLVTSNSDIYVNLRSMKIEGKKASIFVGGGVTKDSVPQKEFEETVAKSSTMKSVLASFIK